MNVDEDVKKFIDKKNAVIAGFLIGLMVSALSIASDLTKDRRQFDFSGRTKRKH
ncbi:hypothetical protein QUF72_08610 [Desulfobacterales bacterium HSG2]|nr:hypothetical protein [Desulfobacterales bacterium HSG2]